MSAAARFRLFCLPVCGLKTATEFQSYLFTVWHGFETSFLTLGKKHTTYVDGEGEGCAGLEGQEAVGGLGKLRNVELHGLYSCPSTVTVKESMS